MDGENKVMDVNSTLDQRHTEYGSFRVQALLTFQLKELMRTAAKWNALEPYQKEALDMLMVKVSRALNGNPNKPDTWLDMAGYAQLAHDTLLGNER